MVHFRGVVTHWVLTPILFYFWGRPRLTVQSFVNAHRNLDHALGIYVPARDKLEVIIPLLQPCEMRRRATQLLEELQHEIEGLCSESLDLSRFWHTYGGIMSRQALTPTDTRRGLDLFQFWTEGDSWKKLAWVKRESAEEMLEICRVHLRQQQGTSRANG